MIVADTHVLIWERTGGRRLGASTRIAFDRALASNELAASAISFWEAGLLKARGRIALDEEVGQWRQILLREGLVEIPVEGDIAIRAAALENFHRDPADRTIVATAQGGHQLLTADRRILDWPGPLNRLDATE